MPSTGDPPLDFGESCALQAQRSQERGLVPGGLFAHCEAIKARRALIEECKDWRPPWVTWWDPTYRHPPGWPENFIDRKPVPPQTADKAKPFQWEVVSLLQEPPAGPCSGAETLGRLDLPISFESKEV